MGIGSRFLLLSWQTVTKTGYFTPYAIAGSVCSAIGSGLMSTFTLNTSAGPWIGYQILAGAGRGLAIQQVPAIFFPFSSSTRPSIFSLTQTFNFPAHPSRPI